MTRPGTLALAVLVAACTAPSQPAASPGPEPPPAAAYPGPGHPVHWPAILRDATAGRDAAQPDPAPARAPALPSPPAAEPKPDPLPIEPPGPYDSIDDHWLELARCESGNWVDGGASFTGPIRWDWGAPDADLPPWGNRLHHGGLQFAPSTWNWIAEDLDLLDQYPHAYDAPPAVQVQVAAEVQARQGWAAWPVCSQKVGLR